nr:unnamed protein product [Spirometra erinaceieuropaei]
MLHWLAYGRSDAVNGLMPKVYQAQGISMEGINNLATECEILRSLYPEEIFTYEVDNNTVIKGTFTAHPKVLLKTIVTGPRYNRQLHFTKKISGQSSVMECQYELDYLPPIYLDFHESIDGDRPRTFISPNSMWLSSEFISRLKNELENILQSPTYESPLWSCFDGTGGQIQKLLPRMPCLRLLEKRNCMKEAFSVQVNEGFNEGNPQCLFCDANATQFEVCGSNLSSSLDP